MVDEEVWDYPPGECWQHDVCVCGGWLRCDVNGKAKLWSEVGSNVEVRRSREPATFRDRPLDQPNTKRDLLRKHMRLLDTTIRPTYNKSHAHLFVAAA